MICIMQENSITQYPDRKSSVENHIPRLLKHERGSRELSMRQFAGVLGVSFQVIERWENGRGQPSTDLLIAIFIRAHQAWVREMAYRCLDLRYPKVFVNPNSNGAH